MSKIKQEKLKWIMEYIEQHGEQDIYETEFIEAYINEFNIQNTTYYWGFDCPRVPEVGRYLAELYHQGRLWRWTTPLIWTTEGVPPWCYRYDLVERK